MSAADWIPGNFVVKVSRSDKSTIQRQEIERVQALADNRRVRWDPTTVAATEPPNPADSITIEVRDRDDGCEVARTILGSLGSRMSVELLGQFAVGDRVVNGGQGGTVVLVEEHQLQVQLPAGAAIWPVEGTRHDCRKA